MRGVLCLGWHFWSGAFVGIEVSGLLLIPHSVRFLRDERAPAFGSLGFEGVWERIWPSINLSGGRRVHA